MNTVYLSAAYLSAHGFSCDDGRERIVLPALLSISLESLVLPRGLPRVPTRQCEPGNYTRCISCKRVYCSRVTTHPGASQRLIITFLCFFPRFLSVLLFWEASSRVPHSCHARWKCVVDPVPQLWRIETRVKWKTIHRVGAEFQRLTPVSEWQSVKYDRLLNIIMIIIFLTISIIRLIDLIISIISIQQIRHIDELREHSDELLRTVWSLVTVRNQLSQRNVVKNFRRDDHVRINHTFDFSLIAYLLFFFFFFIRGIFVSLILSPNVTSNGKLSIIKTNIVILSLSFPTITWTASNFLWPLHAFGHTRGQFGYNKKKPSFIRETVTYEK